MKYKLKYLKSSESLKDIVLINKKERQLERENIPLIQFLGG